VEREQDTLTADAVDSAIYTTRIPAW